MFQCFLSAKARGYWTLSCAFFLFLACLFVPSMEVNAQKEIVVVIDPGHGGGNLGAEYEEYTEKDITLTVALAMQEELSKYDGISVFLTRTEDKEMSLEERAVFAAQVNADLLCCLHFNMSIDHNMYGSEVWVSAFREQYSEGYSFGEAVLKQLDSLGIYRRGVKTKLKDNGEDYYGVIRHSTARGVTSALIEHCYLDQENDWDFYNSAEKLQRLGVLDATAVAQYFGLSSKTLGVSYESYQNLQVETPVTAVEPDTSPPEINYIELLESDKKERTVRISVSAQDSDSGLLYYAYSLDGGQTLSELRKWPAGADTFAVTLEIPDGTFPQITVNAYNGYDGFTASNQIVIDGFPLVSSKPEADTVPPESTEQSDPAQNPEQVLPASKDLAKESPKTEEMPPEREADRSFSAFLKICAVSIGILLMLLLIGYGILESSRRKQRRRRRRK